MEPIENAAFVSVGRAVGFTGLAIACLMLGLSFDALLALKAGAALSACIALILYLRAGTARDRPYLHTEVWLMLKNSRNCPPARQAQQIIGQALSEAYRWFARFAAYIAAGLSVSAILVGVVVH